MCVIGQCSQVTAQWRSDEGPCTVAQVLRVPRGAMARSSQRRTAQEISATSAMLATMTCYNVAETGGIAATRSTAVGGQVR